MQYYFLSILLLCYATFGYASLDQQPSLKNQLNEYYELVKSYKTVINQMRETTDKIVDDFTNLTEAYDTINKENSWLYRTLDTLQKEKTENLQWFLAILQSLKLDYEKNNNQFKSNLECYIRQVTCLTEKHSSMLEKKE